jgi:hypothetical protein
MALGFTQSTGGGDIIPVVKYNAKAGRWSRVDRDNGQNEEIDITRTFKAVFDMENLQTGWIRFAAGQAPEFDLVTYPDLHPSRTPPEQGFKRGVRVLVKLSPECGGDVREIASCANAFTAGDKNRQSGFDKLHDNYLAGLKANAGKLPVVSVTETVPIVTEGGGQKTTNYGPVFEIEKWVSRPADLQASPRPAAEPRVAGKSPPTTGSTKAAPPVNTADDEDWG